MSQDRQDPDSMAQEADPCAKYSVDEATRHDEEEGSTNCYALAGGEGRNAKTNLGQDTGDHTIIPGVSLKFACVHAPSLVGTLTASEETRGGTCPQGRILERVCLCVPHPLASAPRTSRRALWPGPTLLWTSGLDAEGRAL